MDFSQLTVLDFEDKRASISATLQAGGQYVQGRITRENMAQTLAQYVGAGDVLLDLAWNIDCGEIIAWCHEHKVLYLNTSVEVWDPYETLESVPPSQRTLYVRHMALRELTAPWGKRGATAVVEHGANPGLVSHWTKVALEDIAKAMLQANLLDAARQAAIESALADRAYNRLAMLEGVKVIHISERDTQVSREPKRVNEFVNTWSVEGFREEGIAPAEMGWGTHEKRLPAHAHTHNYGPCNQICLAQPAMNTWVRSWVPLGGEIIGMVIRHGEAFTICDHLTVWEGQIPVYRPTVHYAYLPTDAALASAHELKMRNWVLQDQQRIMNDDIIEGRDELGVLLLGHDLNGWWVGSQLDIHEARRLVPGQNATTLQVAASILGALMWMLDNPDAGFNVPDDLPHEEILRVAAPYLGPCPSVQTDWTPLRHRYEPFAQFGKPLGADPWQFESFLAF
jgi:homospermidine synthase